MYTLELTAKNLWAHKRRLAGTVLAVVLGVAFLSGTLLLGDTLSSNFDRLFTQAYGGTDVVVRGATKIGDDTRQNTRPEIAGSLLAQVRAVPGVADAQPYVEGNGQLLSPTGKAIGGKGPPTRAASWISDTSLNPYRLAEGRAPRADNEVVVNRGAMKTGGLHLGDTTTLLTPEPLRVHIVGVSTFGTADGFGPTTFTGMTLHAAQEHLTNRPDEVTEIRVKAAPGVGADALTSRIGAALPNGTQAITGAELASENIDQINAGFLGFVRNALLAFSIIAVLVAAFSIYNTFSILAAQRGRETALQRALGATRRQVIAAGLVEATVIGVLGSVVGLLAGIGFAAALKGVFAGFGFALPAGGLVFEGSSAILAVVAGVVATLGAGVLPTVRASRVAPLAALRDVAAEPTDVSRRRMLVGGLLSSMGIGAVIVAAVGSGGTGLAALGSVLTLIGAVTLGPVAARPAAALIGAPVAVTCGVAGDLARDNAMRSPRRTASTASALMVGVSVVALFTVVGASLKASVTAGVGKSLASDFVVDTSGFGGASGSGNLSPKLAASIAATPGVRDAVPLVGGSARLGVSTHAVTVVDPTRLDDVLHLDPVAGAVAAMTDHGLGVSQSAAKAHHWVVGTPIPVLYPDGASAVLHVAVIYANTDIAGDYLLAADDWNPHAGQLLVHEILVDVTPGADTARVRAALESAARPYGIARVQDSAQFRSSAASGVNTILGLVYVMLTLAIVIAFMGIANTLSLSVYERTRELGLLRSVGQTRRQTRSMIRWESVIIAVFGTMGGVGLGTFLAWALVNSSASSVLAVFSVPPVQLAVFVVIGAVAGVLAAIRPTRHAARLEILRAIASD